MIPFWPCSSISGFYIWSSTQHGLLSVACESALAACVFETGLGQSWRPGAHVRKVELIFIVQHAVGGQIHEQV